MNVSPEVVAQITRDFDLVGVDARREEDSEFAYTMVKLPTGYSILMVMLCLSPLNLRSNAVDVYYG